MPERCTDSIPRIHLTAEIAEYAEKSKAKAVDQRDKLNAITEQVIGAAMEVHRVLGPGLLESAYSTCLAFELRERGFRVEHEQPLPVVYKSVKLDCGYRLDLVVENLVIVEIKAVERLNSVHEA